MAPELILALEHLFTWLVGLFIASVGAIAIWQLKVIHGRIDSLKQDLRNHDERSDEVIEMVHRDNERLNRLDRLHNGHSHKEPK